MTNLPFYQFLDQAPLALSLLGCLAVVAVLGFTGAPLVVWTLAGAVALWGFGAPVWLWITFVALAAVFNLPRCGGW